MTASQTKLDTHEQDRTECERFDDDREQRRHVERPHVERRLDRRIVIEAVRRAAARPDVARVALAAGAVSRAVAATALAVARAARATRLGRQQRHGLARERIDIPRHATEQTGGGADRAGATWRRSVISSSRALEDRDRDRVDRKEARSPRVRAPTMRYQAFMTAVPAPLE